MKFLLLAACLVSVASGYKQFISIDNRNVISDDGRAGGSGSGSGGSGLSGSAFSGAGSGGGSSSWSSGASSGSWGGSGRAGGSKGLAGSASADASPVNKYKATQVVNAAPSIPFVSGGGGGYAQQQQIVAAPISIGGGGAGLGGYSAWDSASASAAPAGGVITAAVITKYSVQYVDVPSTGGAPQVQQIIIPARSQPLDISFESQSSPINVRQVHRPGQAAAPQVSSHQEEPDILKQEIVKPVIHEVLEAIQPIRTVTQEIRPVIETVNQIISRGQEQQQVAVSGVVAAPASQGALVGSIAKPTASAVASQFLQKPVAFPQQSLDISIAKPQLALPQISQVQPQAAVASNQLQQIQQITQQLIEKAKKAAAARRA